MRGVAPGGSHPRARSNSPDEGSARTRSALVPGGGRTFGPEAGAGRSVSTASPRAGFCGATLQQGRLDSFLAGAGFDSGQQLCSSARFRAQTHPGSSARAGQASPSSRAETSSERANKVRLRADVRESTASRAAKQPNVVRSLLALGDIGNRREPFLAVLLRRKLLVGGNRIRSGASPRRDLAPAGPFSRRACDREWCSARCSR